MINEDKFFELYYLRAKNALVSFINSLPQEYGISFISIEEMLSDITKQVHEAALRDYSALLSMYDKIQRAENEKQNSVNIKTNDEILNVSGDFDIVKENGDTIIRSDDELVVSGVEKNE